MKATYRIMGRYEGLCAEELDSCDSREEAERLRGEYIVAFGNAWVVWVETVERTDDRTESPDA
jgi:hypothetical protein